MTDPLVYDVAVIGLGAMGSSAAYHLARRGVNVLGIDQFNPPHTWGSSHGETRVIREAYFEHPSYVPLVQRAYELWAELEEEASDPLYLKTGGVMMGSPESTVVRGAIASARKHSLPHEVLDSAAIKTRFPGLNPKHDMVGVLEPRAGILYAEKCVAAYLRLAGILGAELLMNEKVLGWEVTGDQVYIRTVRNEFVAREIIVSAGAWMAEMIPQLAKVLSVERQVLLWFAAKEEGLFGPERFPIHLWEYEPEKMFYGFPDLGSGVKVAFHHQGEITSATEVEREVSALDIAKMREVLAKYLPAANGEFLRGTVCVYTNTADGHFILDHHPEFERVIVASPCSGHGFKFASAIGEVLADLVLDGKSPLDLSLFRLDRFR
ncbi:MAG: N-methyl-L-tryptophan oxidase [Limisphaerales bacterium]